MIPSILWNASNYNILNFITQALKRSGGTFLLKLGPSFLKANYIFTSDAMNCYHIFCRNSANYDKGKDFKIIMDTLGDGIFNVDGDSWKFQRQLLHSLLNNNEYETHMMRNLCFKMEGTLFRVLDDASTHGTVLDMQDVSKRFMFDNICELVLGFDPCCIGIDGNISSNLYGNALEDLEEGAIYRHVLPITVWRLQNKLNIGMERKMNRGAKIMDRLLYGNIKMKKEALLANNDVATTNKAAQKLDLLTQILVGKDDEDQNGEYFSSRKSDKFLRDTAFTLIAAGTDTVSSGLTWLLWLVATHPDVEEKIIQEIKQTCGRARDKDTIVDILDGKDGRDMGERLHGVQAREMDFRKRRDNTCAFLQVYAIFGWGKDLLGEKHGVHASQGIGKCTCLQLQVSIARCCSCH
ncbi:Alkane hydroxylase MAH1 [Linum perenne]